MRLSALAMINETEEYRLSGQYKLLENACACSCPEDDDVIGEHCGKYYVRHVTTGARVEIDDIGKMILENLPARADALLEMFKTKTIYISPRLTGYYLLLLKEAGIISLKDAKTGAWPIQTHPIDETLKKTEKPNISVVIVSYNGKQFIEKLLFSLGDQTHPPAEIIVTDNASTDETKQIITEKFPHVRLIPNEKNLHYAKAVNLGVSEAKEDLILILNQDIVVEQDCLEKLALRYQQEKEKDKVAGVVPQMRLNKLRTFINGIGNFISHKGWGSDNYFGCLDIGQFADLKTTGSACFGAIMVTRSGWNQIGPLDPVYGSFYEDADWSMRAHKNNLNLLAAPQALIYHEFGGSYPQGLKLSLVLRNRMRFVLKHLKGKTKKKFFRSYLKQDIKNTLSLFRAKQYKEIYYYYKAYTSLAFQLPNILKHRLSPPKTETQPSDTFFTKGAPHVTLANPHLEPVINRHTIRCYYYFLGEPEFQFPGDPITY